MSNILRLAGASGLLAILLTGCAVGPEYRRPTIEVPAAFKEAHQATGETLQWKQAQPADELERGHWWSVFQDPTLDALEKQAMQANQNLRAAAARVRQARALRQGAGADRYPELTVGTGPTRQRTSDAGPQGGSTATAWRAQAGISYEADLFGRVASHLDAASADAQQAQALYQSVMLALQADVAQAYFTIRQLDAESMLYAHTVSLRRAGLDLLETRFHEGDITELDVTRARSELASAQSQALEAARQRAAAEHGLALLLGRAPSEFTLAAQELHRISIDIPAGLPSSLLERRPDIAAAERAVAAANARIGEARAAFFPQIILTGAFGYESTDLGDLLRWSSRSFILGPLAGTMLSLPLFDGGRRQSRVDQARARYEEDVALYRQSVLQAFKEVEDGLSALRLLDEQSKTQDVAAASASRAAELSKAQYDAGSISYLEVIDADREVLRHRQTGVRLDGLRAQATVQLIRALGGGWSQS